MSTRIYNRLWLSPTDYKRNDVSALLEEIGADFEFTDDAIPVNGVVCLDAPEVDADDAMLGLTRLGISFWAQIDARLESGCDRYLFAAHRNEFARVQDDGDGRPAVSYTAGGPVVKQAQIAKKYLTLKNAAEVVHRKEQRRADRAAEKAAKHA